MDADSDPTTTADQGIYTETYDHAKLWCGSVSYT